MKTSIKLFLMAFLLLAAERVHGQKYGHMNLGNLLKIMPETKQANEELKIYTDSLSAKHDSLTKASQRDYSKLEEEYYSGSVTPLQNQERQAELQKQQEFIQKFERESQIIENLKREELLKPILDKVNQTIKNVAKANGFIMVVDSSSGTMLFADESIDIMPLVKTALGLQN